MNVFSQGLVLEAECKFACYVGERHTRQVRMLCGGKTRHTTPEFVVWAFWRRAEWSMKAAATDAGSSSAAPALDLASRLTENAEIVSECLAVLQQLVPQLSAEERVLVATQHPYATPAWLDSLTALSRGQLSDDLLLIVDLERELANCQVLASTRTRQLVEQKSSRGEAGQGHGACLASVDESAAAPSRAAHAAKNGEQREEVLVEPQQQQLLRRQQQEKQKLLQREQQLLQQQRQQQ